MKNGLWIAMGVFLMGCTQKKIEDITPIATDATSRNSDWIFTVRNFEETNNPPNYIYGQATRIDAEFPEFTNRYNGVLVAPAEPSPQGGNCYYVSGQSSEPVYYFGGADFPIDFPWLDEDPSNVYFNAYVKGDGNVNTEIHFSVAERSILRTPINWEGWKLLSVRLSDVDITDLTKLELVSIGLGSEIKSNTSSAQFDNLTFTVGSPYSEE